MLHVVGGLLVNKDNIILPKRTSVLAKYPGFYEFSGGKVDVGETLKSALKRELNEELTIYLDESDILEFNENSFTTDKMILTIFIIKKWKENITLDPKIHSGMIEVTIDGLENVEDLLKTDKELVSAIISVLS